MLLACETLIECNAIQEIPHDMWYLDSGCRSHMTGNSIFFSLDNSVQTDVTLGNNVQVIVLGKGTVGILTKQGDSKYIPDVYHFERLKHNLLRIVQLIQKGYKFYMEDNHCVIKDIRPSNELIKRVPMTRNHLFPLRIVPDNT